MSSPNPGRGPNRTAWVRWAVLGIVAALFAALCFLVLAPWQLGKNTDTSHRNELIERYARSEPVPVATAFPGGALGHEQEWRPVTATGTFDADNQVLVRLRSVDGAPAYLVLIPFHTDQGEDFVVKRGFVRPTTGTEVPTIAPPPGGEVTITARARRGEGSTPDRTSVVEAGYTQLYSIDPAVIGAEWNLAVADGYLEELTGSPGALGVEELPQLDSGPYLSYGLQWLAFGIAAPLGLGYFVFAEIRERRRIREENLAAAGRAAADSESDGTAPDSASTEAPALATDSLATGSAVPSAESPLATPAPPTPGGATPAGGDSAASADTAAATRREDRLADRYGRSRR